jgi:stage II sporulation protein D
VTRLRLVKRPGLAWAAALAGAWLAAAACRTMQGGAVASAVPAAESAPVDPFASVPEPRIRVGILVEVERVALAAGSGVVVRGRAPGESAWLRRELRVATLVPGEAAGRVRLAETGEDLEGAVVTPAAPEELLRAGSTVYRGAVEVRPAGGERLTAVNVVHLEDYLRGVVPNELSPHAFPELEAQKAQAVAARSWALAHLGDYASKGFDVCASPACQVYRGVGSEHPLTDRAIDETRGVVATWRGKPIHAYYTSTCGGHTEDGAAIFEDAAPYLRGVRCALEGRGDGAPAETGIGSLHLRWEVRLTPAEVGRALRRYGSVGEVRDIVPKRLGVSGRVVELAVVGSDGELDLRGLRVRWGLGLRENLFVIDRETGPGGEIEEFVISGRGWGHGVGLCQVGASRMARGGAPFGDILKHYYAGVRVDRL